MSHTTQTLTRLVIWNLCLTLERWHLSHVHDSLTSSCTPSFMCYYKIIIIWFWQTSHWVTYGWLAAGRQQERQSNPGNKLVLVQRPTHTKKRPFQSFPWFLFWAASMVSTVSQAPPKKWHILRPDASDSQYRAVIISRAFFFLSEREGRLFLTNDESLNILPPLEHTNTHCQILQGFSPDEGCLKGMTLRVREARQRCVITGNATFTFSHCT